MRRVAHAGSKVQVRPHGARTMVQADPLLHNKAAATQPHCWERGGTRRRHVRHRTAHASAGSVPSALPSLLPAPSMPATAARALSALTRASTGSSFSSFSSRRSEEPLVETLNCGYSGSTTSCVMPSLLTAAMASSAGRRHRRREQERRASQREERIPDPRAAVLCLQTVALSLHSADGSASRAQQHLAAAACELPAAAWSSPSGWRVPVSVQAGKIALPAKA